MAEILFEHNQIDDAYIYISPEIVAMQGEEAVLPSLRLAQAALSAFHPDIIDENEVTLSRGEQSLAHVNQIIQTFEKDNELTRALYADSVVITRDSTELLRSLKSVNDVISETKHLISNVAEIGVINGCVELALFIDSEFNPKRNPIYADTRLLSFFVGPEVMDLLDDSSVETQNRILNQLRNKLSKSGSTLLSTFGISRINQFFDQYLDSIKAVDNTISQDGEALTNKNEALISEEERIDSELKSLIEKFKPHAKHEYPDTWLRSYTGSLVLPIDEFAWKDYNKNFVSNLPIEMGVFRECIIENGVVMEDIVIDTTSRDSLELVDDMETDRKEWINALIALTAEKVKFPKGSFVTEFGEGSESYLDSMDFVFKVDQAGTIKVLYTKSNRPGADNQSVFVFNSEDYPDFKKFTAPSEGYYMVKAGKNKSTQQYDRADTPLALIGLDVEKLIPRQSKLVGKALIASLPSGKSLNSEYVPFGDAVRYARLVDPIKSSDYREIKNGTGVVVKSNNTINMIKNIMANQDQKDSSFFEIPKYVPSSFNNQTVILLDSSGDMLVVNTLKAHRARFES